MAKSPRLRGPESWENDENYRQGQGQRRDAGAAPLCRQIHSQNTQRGELGDILVGKSGVLVDVLRSRRELAFGESPQGVLEQALFGTDPP